MNDLPIKKGDVVQDIVSKEILVVGVGIRTQYVLEHLNEYKFISDIPHSDGDYSYICGKDYCKCMQ